MSPTGLSPTRPPRAGTGSRAMVAKAVGTLSKETSSSSINSALRLQASASDEAADDLVTHNLGSSRLHPSQRRICPGNSGWLLFLDRFPKDGSWFFAIMECGCYKDSIPINPCVLTQNLGSIFVKHGSSLQAQVFGATPAGSKKEGVQKWSQ